MANKYHANVGARVRGLFNSIAERLGIEMDFSFSPSFKVELTSGEDGQSVSVRGSPIGQGWNNPFGTEDDGHNPRITTPVISEASIKAALASLESADGVAATLVSGVISTVALVNVAGDVLFATTAADGMPTGIVRVTRVSDSLVQVEEMFEPLTATDTLAAGVNAAIPLVNAAGDWLAVEEVTAGGDPANHFSVNRISNALVNVEAHDAAGAVLATNTSVVRVINWGQVVDTVQGTLVAGTLTPTLPNAVGDRLIVEQVSAGGDAADHFSVFRAGANTVTVFAHDAAGAVVATNTSVVRVVNMGRLPRDVTKTTALKAYNLGTMI